MSFVFLSFYRNLQLYKSGFITLSLYIMYTYIYIN